MARESNSTKLANYRGALDTSIRYRKDQGYDNLWIRMINLYRGRQYRGVANGDRLLVNICFSTINTLAPAISIGRPKINVNARRPDDGDKAVVTESIINYWWQHYDCQPEFQRAVKDYLILGLGWVKTGYRFVEEEKIADIQETADEAADPGPLGEVESSFIIREDRPFLERVDPFDIYVDANAISMEDIRWIAQRIRRPIEEVKDDKRYDATARKDVSISSVSKYGETGGAGINDNVTAAGINIYDGYVDVYEYYDIETSKMCVFADGGDKFLIKPTDIPYAFGHPFVMLRNYDIPNYFYPMGELEAIEPLQYELNETRTQMMNHRKRYSRKYLFMESAFDDNGRAALASDEDNAMVPVKGGENLANVVVPMPALINPPDFYNQSSLIENDIDRVSGVSEYQRGAIPETTRTAREASIIAEAGNARVSEKLIQMENSIASCASNLIMLAQQYLTGEQTVRIVGSESAPIWLTFDKDYISGEFDFTVEAGSTAPRNEAFRRDMSLQIVSAMMPFAEAGLINMPKLAEYVLATGFGIKNPGAFMQQAPPPQGLPPEQGGLPPEGGIPAEGPLPEEGIPGQGGEQLPPELMAMLAQAQGAGGPPDQGPLTQIPLTGPAPQIPEGLPPELAGLPPEVLQAILAQMGQQQ